jgi:phospholipid/cholesterol/gamma-HCH transport system substrate-binding protein
MRQSRSRHLPVETAAFVILGCFSFWFLVTQIAHRGAAVVEQSHYDVNATFENIGGLKPGARVSMSGVEIGRVARITLNHDQSGAKVLLRMSDRFKEIPKDSTAFIVTQGVLGGQSIAMTAGAAAAYLDQGDEIQTTRSAFVLEKSIGRLVAHFISSSGQADRPPPP